MPYPIAALISWRPFYQSVEEPFFTTQNHDVISHDFQNFLRSGSGNGFFYGYAPVMNPNMKIQRLADDPIEYKDAESIEGIQVYWLARRPSDQALCLVGWYEDAEAFRYSQQSPMRLPGNPEVWYRFRARRAFLLPEDQRAEVDLEEFGLPSSQLHASITYLNEHYPDLKRPHAIHALRQRLEILTHERLRPGGIAATATIQEFRRKRTHETIERSNNYRQFRQHFGNACQACGFEADEEPWSRALELHHLVPMRELALDEVRNVTHEEFALLCANCHRAIHATEFFGCATEFWQRHRR